MKVNGKSKTPITAAQSKRKSGEGLKPSDGKPGGTRARASQQTSKSKINAVKTAVLERISDGILAFDAGMNYTYLNERAGELLGRSAEDLVGKNLQEEYAGADRTPFMEACQRALGTQSVVWLNEYFPPTDTWLEGRVYPSAEGVSVLFTEGRRQKEEDRYRILVDAMQEAFLLADVIADQNGEPGELRFADLNTAMERFLGKSRHEVVGRTVREIFPLDERELQLMARIARVGLGAEPFFLEEFSGSLERWYQAHIFSPRPGQVAGLAFDITERKKTEETLRGVINQTSTGIAHTDMQGRLVFANDSFSQMLGYSEEELKGMTIWDITERDLQEKNKLQFEHLLSHGEGYQLEKQILSRSGSTMWISVGVAPLRDAEGRIRGATAVIVDITRRKRAEASLLDSARRSLFLSSLSDTIRSIESPSKIQVEAACLLGGHLKVSRVTYLQVEADGTAIVRANYVDGLQEMNGTIPIHNLIPHEQLPKFRAGRAVVTSDVQRDVRFSQAQRSAHEALSIQAQIIQPFLRNGQVTAALCIQQAEPRTWKEEEISLVDESAERMQTAIERAQAEQKLHDSEKYYRILAENVPSLVWSMTPDGQIQYLNERWQTYTGLPVEESFLEWVKQIVHPEDFERCLASWQTSRSMGEENRLEVRLRRFDGEYRWFQSHSIPARDDNGSITAWHGVLADIHERVERERELRQIIDNTPFILLRNSRDLRYRFVSRAAAELLGSTPEALEGRPLVDVLGERTFNSILPHINEVLQGRPVHYENEIRLPGRDPIFVQAYYVPDIDEQGEVLGWFASLVDITERKKLENDLRAGEQKFNLIYSKLPFTAALLRPEDGVIVDVNEEFTKVFGYARQDTVGRTFPELGIDSTMEERVRILAELQASVSVRNMELELLAKPYGPRTFLVNTDVVNINGTEYILQTAQDITERKQMEESLRQSEQKFSLIYDNLPFAAALSRPEDGTFVDVNQEFERVFGYSRQEVRGKTSFDLEINPSEEQRARILAELELRGSVRNQEIALNTRQLGQRTFLMNVDQVSVGGARYILQTAQDITNRKKAEEELRTSEERMRLAIESNRMVAWEWDVAADRVTASENMVDIYGLANVTSKVEGFALVLPEDLAAHQEKVDRIIYQGGEYQSEFRITRPVDGRVVWLEERAKALTDDKGRVIRLVGVVTDITSRKRAEQELSEYAHQQEVLYRLADSLQRADSLQEVFDPALDAIQNALHCQRASILLFDKQDVMRFVAWRGLSDAYRQATTGHSPWTRLEVNAQPICVEDVATSDLSESLKDVIKAEGIGALAFMPLVSNEKLIGKFMMYYNAPHVFGEGEIELSQTIAHQVAANIERKQAEQELQQNRQRLALTYHHAPIGINETSREGNFLQVNDEYCRMVGYSYDELLTRGIRDVTHPEDVDKDLDLYQKLVTGEIPFYRIEKRFVRKDGSLLWAEIVRSMVRDQDGKALYGIGGVLDISLRKQKEEELRARTEEVEALMDVSPIAIFFAGDPECTSITGNPAGYHLVEMPQDSSGNLSKSAPEHERPTYRTFRRGIELTPEQLPMQVAARLGMEIEEETLELRFDNGAKKFIYAYAKPLFDAQGKTRGAIAAMLDITERMKREEELRARTEEVEALMEVSPIGIMVAHDPQCSHITGNPAAYSLLGLPPDSQDNLSNPVLEVKGPAHRVYRDGVELSVEDLPMQASARLGIEVEDESLEIRFEDGTKKYVYFFAKPLFDSEGRTRGTIAAMLDVTERKRSEEALRSSEERFSKAFLASPDSISISRRFDGQILEVNNSWISLFGYEPDEIVGKSSLDVNLFANPEDRKRALDLLEQQGYVRDFALDIRRKSGEIRHTIVSAERIEIGSVDCLLTILRDVTDRRLAEEALRRSEERFTRFMHNLPGLAWIKDMQGRYVFANAAAQRAFNVSAENLYGRTDWEIFQQEIATQFQKNDDRAVAEEGGVQVVESLPQPDGVVHHSLVTKFPIPGPDGHPVLIGGTAFDITERIQMETDLRIARARAEHSAYRMTQLQKVTAALSQAATPVQVAKLVVEGGAPILGAVSSSVLQFNEEEQFLEMIYSSSQEEVFRPFLRFPLSMQVPASDAIRSGQPVWIRSREEYLERYPHLSELIRKWGFQAAIAVPMVYQEHVLGVVTLSFDKELPLSLEDQEYILTLARQGTQALERARVEYTLRLDATMMENVSAGIYLVRASDGTLIHTNPRFDSLFGYAPGEVIGKHVSILNAQTDHTSQEVAGKVIENLHKEGSWQGEVLSIRKDGRKFWAFATVTTFQHPHHGTVWVAARQDITLQKQVEEALRESEQRYRAIVSQATAGIVRKDSEGRLLFVNQAFCSMLGYTDQELIGKEIWNLVHAEDMKENQHLYQRLLAEGIPFQLEKRLIHKSGSILWVNASVSPVVDASGRTQSAVSVYVDVTRSRQAESRLALLAEVSEMTRKYDEPGELFFGVSRLVGEYFNVRRSLFNEIDLENDREVVHRDYCRDVHSVAGVHAISDYSSITTAEMMAGKTIVNRDSKLDPRTSADYERSYVAHGERAYVAIPLLREERWVASLWISDDKPREWDKDEVSLLETIAERTWTAAEKLRIDRALRDSEERLRVTFNTTVLGFATLKLDLYFMDVNDAFCQIVAYPRQELLEMRYDSLTHPEFHEETKDRLARLLAGEISSFTIEKIFIRRDGTELWVQNSISIVRDADGEPLHLIVICQDITERKRSDKALQESNQRYQTLVEVSPYAIFVNKDGRIVFANNECIRMFGAESPEQIIGRSNFDFLHPDYHDLVKERILLLMRGRENAPPIEEKIIRIDGEVVDVEITASPFIEKGEPAILVTMNDITERKQAEQALHQLNLELEERVRRRTVELQAANEFLRESESTSRLILESMPDAIVIIDRNGQIVHTNTQVEALFGYSPSEIMGQPVEALVPSRFHSQHAEQRGHYGYQRSRRIMGLGQDLYGKRKDESEFPVEVMLAPIDNSTNWDVLVAIRDNTRQRQAQEALRTNEEKLRRLFEILPVGTSFLNKEGKVSELNNALTEILDLPRSDILAGQYRSRQFIRADGTSMPPSEFASARARAEQKTVYNVETGIVKENGEVTWTSVNAAPVQVADVEAVIVTVDITERKRAEEALHKHRERLKLLSRRLVEVQEEERHAIARELHDRVGQNLAALTLNLNILRNQLSGEVLDKVGTRLSDSVALVKDILTITRSVMADLRPNVLDDYGLEAAINEYAERFSQRYGIRVITHTLAKAIPRLDPGVEMTLLRIAQEALTNVARHSQASQVVMILELESDAILMTIEDNGQGILSWQKVNQPGSHGLRIMRERAEAFGGYLKVHSTYKNGTKIEVKIPLASSVSGSSSKEKRS